jgi:hypothetical protein
MHLEIEHDLYCMPGEDRGTEERWLGRRVDWDIDQQGMLQKQAVECDKSKFQGRNNFAIIMYSKETAHQSYTYQSIQSSQQTLNI